MTVDVVFFDLRGRRCALPVAVVREVLAVPALTPVPMAPSALRGIAPVHGQILPIIDLGVWLSPGGGDSRGEVHAASRSQGDKALVVETGSGDVAPGRAVLLVERLMRLGAIDDQHSRPPPPGPPFVSATVLDQEGPALLIDAERALDHVRDAIRAGVRT